MRRAPADALGALAEMPIAGSPPRLSTHPDRSLAALHPPSRSALTSNPHSARCPAGAPTSRDFVPWRFLDACHLSVPTPSLLPASKNLHNACLHPRYCRRPKTCTIADIAARPTYSGQWIEPGVGECRANFSSRAETRHKRSPSFLMRSGRKPGMLTSPLHTDIGKGLGQHSVSLH